MHWPSCKRNSSPRFIFRILPAAATMVLGCIAELGCITGQGTAGVEMDVAVKALLRSRLVICLWLAALGGCFQSPPPASAPKVGAGERPLPRLPVANADQLTANEILDRLLKTYRSAATYQDGASSSSSSSRRVSHPATSGRVQCSLPRPNKLSLAAYQAVVKCDGHELVAKITDEATVRSRRAIPCQTGAEGIEAHRSGVGRNPLRHRQQRAAPPTDPAGAASSNRADWQRRLDRTLPASGWKMGKRSAASASASRFPRPAARIGSGSTRRDFRAPAARLSGRGACCRGWRVIPASRT